MSENIIMPKLGMTMLEGTVEEWHKKVGEKVDSGEVMVTISSEKLTQEVEATISGILLEIIVNAGNETETGGILGVIGQKDEDSSEVSVSSSGSKTDVEAEMKKNNIEKDEQNNVTAETQLYSSKRTIKSSGSNLEERIFISPLARRMAEDNNLQLEHIIGSGGNKRITRLDINRILERGYDSGAEKHTIWHEMTSSAEKVLNYESTDEGLNPMRKVIAQNMRNSLNQTAQLTLHRKARVDQLIDFQKTLRSQAEMEKINLKLSLTVMIARATVLALKDYGKMNSIYRNGVLTEYDQVHLGIATALDEGLVVPVVKNAEQKTIGDLAQAMENVITAAQEGQTDSDLLTGSTFTITNMGASGIEYFTPILNTNESGILGVGSLQEELYLNENDQMKMVKNIPFSLTFDHQILDGADAAEFLKILVKYIESPYLLVL